MLLIGSSCDPILSEQEACDICSNNDQPGPSTFEVLEPASPSFNVLIAEERISSIGGLSYPDWVTARQVQSERIGKAVVQKFLTSSYCWNKGFCFSSLDFEQKVLEHNH